MKNQGCGTSLASKKLEESALERKGSRRTSTKLTDYFMKDPFEKNWMLANRIDYCGGNWKKIMQHWVFPGVACPDTANQMIENRLTLTNIWRTKKGRFIQNSDKIQDLYAVMIIKFANCISVEFFLLRFWRCETLEVAAAASLGSDKQRESQSDVAVTTCDRAGEARGECRNGILTTGRHAKF
ncbi:hypothetical protein ACJJTC_011242 [Scirpophaga incertulas]